MSGAGRNARFGGGYDLHVPMFGRELKTECKHYANGFRTLYKWLVPVDLLIIRRDHGEPLVVIPLKTLVELAQDPSKGVDVKVV